MPTAFRYFVALTLSLVPAIATGQGTARSPQVAWWPRVPLQGSLVRVVLRRSSCDSVTAVYGELAGEPLQFQWSADELLSLGATPSLSWGCAAVSGVMA